MIVVDTTVLAHLVLPGEHTTSVLHLRGADPDWRAPLLWRSELRNVLATQVRMERLDLETALEAMALAEQALGGRGYMVDTNRVLFLAAQSGCSAYDCEFVALAMDLAVSLATTDRQLLDRFPDVAVAPQDAA